MTLRQLLNDAIEWDEPKLAYAIYWASTQGFDLNNSFDDLKQLAIDFSEVDKLVQLDPLGISKIKMYSCKDGDGFHLIFAERIEDARGMLINNFGRIPNAVIDVSHGFDKHFYDATTRKFEWVRKVKNETISFPHYYGYLERERTH